MKTAKALQRIKYGEKQLIELKSLLKHIPTELGAEALYYKLLNILQELKHVVIYETIRFLTRRQAKSLKNTITTLDNIISVGYMYAGVLSDCEEDEEEQW